MRRAPREPELRARLGAGPAEPAALGRRQQRGVAVRGVEVEGVLGVDGAGAPKLQGSVGEGPNQTNYSNRGSVRICSEFRNFEF